MALLLAEACGVDSEKERDFFEAYFRPAIRECQPADYRQNFYLQRIAFPGRARGRVRAGLPGWNTPHASCSWRATSGGMRKAGEIAPLGFFYNGFSYPALLSGDRVWMTVTPLEIETRWPGPFPGLWGNVVAFGLGLGCYPLTVAQKAEVSSVTVVERDPMRFPCLAIR